jgi:hypothetical protein
MGQTQPRVCGGGKERYGLFESGLPGSIYKWSVIGGHIDADYKDSVDVTWYPETQIGKLLVTEISKYGCSGNPDTAYITISHASLTFKLQSAIVCEGTSNTVTVEGNFLKYNWSNGNTNKDLTVSTGGLYKLTALSTDSCLVEDSITMAFYPKPYVNLGSHDTILCSPTMVLNAGTDGQSYHWSNGEITNSILVSNINDGQVFSVVVENEYGCTSSDTINVKACGIIPNTITPNGDGSNDTWQCDKFMGSKVDVQIFDRWGRLVYHSKSGLPAEGWDGTLRGKPLPMDSYYYIVNLNDGSDVIKGTITIIR